MKPLYTRLQEVRKRLGLPWEVLERDYVQSWILGGIGRVADLRDVLALKGGTALRKCYFGDYRLSEDLDFTGLEDVPVGMEMEDAIEEVCSEATALLEEYSAVEIACERYTEKEPHPAGQEAFIIRVRLPWHRRPQLRVMIEITVDEPVQRGIQQRMILHDFGEPFKLSIGVYSLEEIIAEKLRAILQHVRILEERGWSRSRARDFYDLWRILNTYSDQLNLAGFNEFLSVKCAVRDVAFNSAEDFFPETVLYHVENSWEQWLGTLVPGLPPFETVVNQLRPQIETLLSMP